MYRDKENDEVRKFEQGMEHYVDGPLVRRKMDHPGEESR